MISKNTRRKFLEFFKEKGHLIVPSSPVIPYEDPTLLFTNAGMNQFKDLFLGRQARDYRKAASAQKCIRAGGKHNDLENVGHTRRHLTFFEMLGNFSFGDYFKKEAIQFAWELSTEVLGLDSTRIWPSVYEKDDEAYALWTAYVPESRICRLTEKDNFWSMGETGPCGPCSELYYDLGKERHPGPSPKEDPEGVRFLEYWNLVFMEFNRDESGTLHKLPKPSIDTGMGLERLVSLLMNVDSVYETDILRAIIAKTEALFQKPYKGDETPAFRVIADHLRTLSFAIADGQEPSNVDRGYVLRKILRRAVRYGRELGASDPFLAHLVPTLIEMMGEDYPELIASQKRIQEVLTEEEALFLKTLKKGESLLHKIIKESTAHKKVLSGEDIFLLKDTFGFPVDEVALMAVDFGLTLDMARFSVLEQEAREKSKQGRKSIKGDASFDFATRFSPTEFVGYKESRADTKITCLYSEGHEKEFLQEGDEALILLEKSPFYAEMGGQVGDQGWIFSSKGDQFQVTDTKAVSKGVVGHFGRLIRGRFELGDPVVAEIDLKRRKSIENHHTATHLLHYGLVKILGPHVKQSGSLVEEGRLRFDFSHGKALTKEEIMQIEDLVNRMIRENSPVSSYQLSFEEASKRTEIKQFFGEKYGLEVRVIDIPFESDASRELCGGTHVKELGRIGFFRILKESGIAQGVRRIEAATGPFAETFLRSKEALVDQLVKELKVPEERLLERFKEIQEETKKIKFQLDLYKKQERQKRVSEILADAIPYKEKKASLFSLETSVDEGRLLVEDLFSKEEVEVIIALILAEGKAHLLIRGKESWVKAGNDASLLLKELLPSIHGQGGGKALSAQGQGMYIAGVNDLLENARKKLKPS